jgi:hypothetical protein
MGRAGAWSTSSGVNLTAETWVYLNSTLHWLSTLLLPKSTLISYNIFFREWICGRTFSFVDITCNKYWLININRYYTVYSKSIFVRDWSKRVGFRNIETIALFQLLTPSACNNNFFGPKFGPKSIITYCGYEALARLIVC